MDNNEFMNTYVERLIGEIVDLTKHRMLIDTKMIFTEKMNQVLAAKVQELEARVAELEQERTQATEAKVPFPVNESPKSPRRKQPAIIEQIREGGAF